MHWTNWIYHKKNILAWGNRYRFSTKTTTTTPSVTNSFFSTCCQSPPFRPVHYNDVIMRAMASQITSLTIVYSTVYSRRRSKKTSKLRITDLCAGNSPVTGELPAQRVSNAENISIWWRHHDQLVRGVWYGYTCVAANYPEWCWGRNIPGGLNSIPWLPMLWQLTAPEHRQPRYRLCRINGNSSILNNRYVVKVSSVYEVTISSCC